MRDLQGSQHTYGFYTSYSELVDSFETEVLVVVEDDDYEGDSRYLLRDGDRYGFLMFGWGSCSGCDALEACDTLEEATALRDSLWEDVHWEDSASAMAEYIAGKDWTLEWYGRRTETAEFNDKAMAALGATPAAQAA